MRSRNGDNTTEWHCTYCKRYRNHCGYTVRCDASIGLNYARLDSASSRKYKWDESAIAESCTEPDDSLPVDPGNAAGPMICRSRGESHMDSERGPFFLQHAKRHRCVEAASCFSGRKYIAGMRAKMKNEA